MRGGAAAILRRVRGDTGRPRMVALMVAVLIPAIVANSNPFSPRHAISRRSRDTFRRTPHGLLDALLTGQHLVPAPMQPRPAARELVRQRREVHAARLRLDFGGLVTVTLAVAA